MYFAVLGAVIVLTMLTHQLIGTLTKEAGHFNSLLPDYPPILYCFESKTKI